MISVEARTINMTKVPKVAVEEGSVAEYICVTDSAYPEPPGVLWFVNDMSVSVNDGYTVKKSHPGDYHGLKTKGTLRLTANRWMNKKQVKCSMRNNATNFNEHTLNVTCKYLLLHIYQAV